MIVNNQRICLVSTESKQYIQKHMSENLLAMMQEWLSSWFLLSATMCTMSTMSPSKRPKIGTSTQCPVRWCLLSRSKIDSKVVWTKCFRVSPIWGSHLHIKIVGIFNATCDPNFNVIAYWVCSTDLQQGKAFWLNGSWASAAAAPWLSSTHAKSDLHIANHKKYQLFRVRRCWWRI